MSGRSSLLVSLVGALPNSLLKILPAKLCVLLFLSAMYRANLEGSRKFFSTIQGLTPSLADSFGTHQFSGFGWPLLEGVARSHSFFEGRQWDVDENENVVIGKIPTDSAGKANSAYARGLLRGHLLHFQILSGRELSENRFIVAAAPTFLDDGGENPTMRVLVDQLDYLAPGKVAVVPSYLLPFLNSPERSRIWSHHTVGRCPQMVHFKAADVPPYLCIDPEGFGGWATLAFEDYESLGIESSPEDIKFAQQWATRYHLSNRSKYEQAPLGTNNLPGDFVFVALQVTSDLSQKLRRWPQWVMLLMVATRFAGSGLKTVVKRHPKCESRVIGGILYLLEKTRLIQVTKASIHELISKSRAVFTVNSGVGSEALMYEKPVYLFGAADYQLATWQVKTLRDFWKITKDLTLPLDLAELRAFNSYYRSHYLIDTENPQRLKAAISEFNR